MAIFYLVDIIAGIAYIKAIKFVCDIVHLYFNFLKKKGGVIKKRKILFYRIKMKK